MKLLINSIYLVLLSSTNHSTHNNRFKTMFNYYKQKEDNENNE
jgi:hypothetical protein